MQEQPKAGEQQSRAHEQGEGKTNLSCDEQLPRPARFLSAGAGAGLFAQSVANTDLGDAGERKQPDKDSGSQR